MKPIVQISLIGAVILLGMWISPAAWYLLNIAVRALP